MKNVIVVQAQLTRDGDTRDGLLFDKVNGVGILENTIGQCRKSRRADEIVLYSSKGNLEAVTSLAIALNLKIYCRNTLSTVSDFEKICEEEKADTIIRVIGCNPLLQPDLVDKGIAEHTAANADYTYMDGYPRGIVPSEIIGKHCFRNSVSKSEEDTAAVNVTTSIKLNKKLFAVNRIKASQEYFDYSAADLSYRRNTRTSILKLIQKDDVSWINICGEVLSIPSRIRNIEVTSLCNLRCAMCHRIRESSLSSGRRGRMTFEIFKRIVDQFEVCTSVGLSGGEPFVNTEVYEMLKYLGFRGIDSHLTTNFLVAKESMFETIIDNLGTLEISIDGATRETYESIRIGGSFEILEEKVTRFMDVYNRSSHPALQMVRVHYVVSKKNFREMPAFVSLMSRWGVRNIVFIPYVTSYINPLDNKEDEMMVGGGELDEYIELARSAAKKAGINIGAMMKHTFQFDNFCDCDWYKENFWVTWEGYVTPCCIIDRPEVFNFGNLASENIRELYNSKKWRDYRWRLFNDDPPSECKKYCTAINR